MKAILFDFDGVLVDTLDVVFAINQEADPNITLEQYKAHFDGNVHEAIKAGKKKRILDFDERYKLRTRELKIPEVLKEIVKDLSLKCNLAIVSSTHSSSIEEILDREGLSSCFKDILGCDVDTSKVVKNKMFLEKYNTSPEDAIFITDTTGDVGEARVCGIKSIAVTWGFQERATLEKSNPARIVSSPEELSSALKELL